MSFPRGSASKESTCNVGDLGSIPGLGRSPEERKSYPLVFWPREFHGLYSPWGHKESDTTEQLSLSLSSYNWASLMAQMVKNLPVVQETQIQSWVGKISWRREWLPTLVLLPGEFHGQRSLVGCSPWAHKESDSTE